MTTVRFSSSGSATATGSVSVALGGTPNVGDLVVIWLGVSNEIVTHQPNYQVTSKQWSEAGSLRSRLNASTLNAWYHTWNASDSGSSVSFTVSPAPSLHIGDKDLSSADVVWVTATLAGPTARSEFTVQDGYDPSGVVHTGPLKRAHSAVLTACHMQGGSTYTDSDPGASAVASVADSTQSLTVFLSANPSAGYRSTITSPTAGDLLTHTLTVNDSPPFLYNPPVIYEGPVAWDRLLMRYTLMRYYTVFNNTGTFTASRYNTTDAATAATQVFTNNQPVTSTDRTNLLNSGVGGDFVSA